MPVNVTQQVFASFLSKTQLMKLRSKAIRAGVWFKVLPRIDRALIDLTIMVANNVHSVVLAKSLLAISSKLEKHVAGGRSRFSLEIGIQLAQKLSLLAQQWGNIRARSWAFEPNFANFLAVIHANEHKTY
jgi:hypothetical protein